MESMNSPATPSEESFSVPVQCLCGYQMSVDVGLTLTSGLQRTIACPKCGRVFRPLVHGPIVAGPFPAE